MEYKSVRNRELISVDFPRPDSPGGGQTMMQTVKTNQQNHKIANAMPVEKIREKYLNPAVIDNGGKTAGYPLLSYLWSGTSKRRITTKLTIVCGLYCKHTHTHWLAKKMEHKK